MKTNFYFEIKLYLTVTTLPEILNAKNQTRAPAR
jgi:hypothetical protein